MLVFSILYFLSGRHFRKHESSTAGGQVLLGARQRIQAITAPCIKSKSNVVQHKIRNCDVYARRLVNLILMNIIFPISIYAIISNRQIRPIKLK
jgi:hypothetical protein